MTPPVAMPAPADAALAASQGQRLIKRAAALVFPQLTEALLHQGASSLESARQSAMTHILRMAIALYANARGLGECPFWPATPEMPLPKDAIQTARALLACDTRGEAVEFATLPVRCSPYRSRVSV